MKRSAKANAAELKTIMTTMVEAEELYRQFKGVSAYLRFHPLSEKASFIRTINLKYRECLQALLHNHPNVIRRCIAEGNFPANAEVCQWLAELAPKTKDFVPQRSESPVDEWVRSTSDILIPFPKFLAALMRYFYLSALNPKAGLETASAICTLYQVPWVQSKEEILLDAIRFEGLILEKLKHLTTLEQWRDYIAMVQGSIDPKSECSQILASLLEEVRPEAPVNPVHACLEEIRELSTQANDKLAHDMLKIMKNTDIAEQAKIVLQNLSYYFAHLENPKRASTYTQRIYVRYLQLMIHLIQSNPDIINELIRDQRFPTHPTICCLLGGPFEKPSPLGMLREYLVPEKLDDAEEITRIQEIVGIYLKQLIEQNRISSKSQPLAESLTKLIIEALDKHSRNCDIPQGKYDDAYIEAVRLMIRRILEIFIPRDHNTILAYGFTGLI